MPLRVVRFQAEHEPAVAAFNARIRHVSPFLIPESAPAPSQDGPVRFMRYLAVEDQGDVRGGVICLEHPARVGDRIVNVINLQSPLSEGISDSRHAMVAPQLIRFALKQTPFVYVVGMGDAGQPLPRVLSALGWRVRGVPFYFSLLRPSRCLRELGPLRQARAGRVAAWLAAVPGVEGLLRRAVHRSAAASVRRASAHTVRPVDSWGEWVQEIWERFAGTVSFGVVRSQQTLPALHPIPRSGFATFCVERNAKPVGWFSLVSKPMSGSPQFGNLKVTTLADCIGDEDAIYASIPHAVRQATVLGADLLITNQQHHVLRSACLAAGLRQGPTNYLLATSKAFADQISEETAYVTRRDGDGLVHLAPE